MSKIMFVCTGNICRSPMAEGLLRQRFQDEGLGERHQVTSTGVWASDGHPASANSVTAMAEQDIDIAGHSARTIIAHNVNEAELILVMSREHAQMIKQTWPQYKWKVYLLSEMVRKKQDVSDPYGGSLQEYREAAKVIATYIDNGFERILELI